MQTIINCGLRETRVWTPQDPSVLYILILGRTSNFQNTSFFKTRLFSIFCLPRPRQLQKGKTGFWPSLLPQLFPLPFLYFKNGDSSNVECGILRMYIYLLGIETFFVMLGNYLRTFPVTGWNWIDKSNCTCKLLMSM